MGLYGGLTAQDIQRRKRLKKGRQILNHMGNTELAANLFRATQTEEKLRRDNIKARKRQIERIVKSVKKSVRPSKSLAGQCLRIYQWLRILRGLRQNKERNLKINQINHNTFYKRYGLTKEVIAIV